MRSSRWQAQGNVYLVAEEGPLTAERVARRRSATPTASSRCSDAGDDWVEIAIWNPDGSLAEMSGNGTRIAARWLAERTGADRSPCASGRARCARAMLDDGLVEQDLGPVVVGEPEEVAGHPAHAGRRRQPACRRRRRPRRPAAHRAAARDAPALPATDERAGRAPRRRRRSRPASGSAAWGRPRRRASSAVAVAAAFGGEPTSRSASRAAISTSASRTADALLTGPAERVD